MNLSLYRSNPLAFIEEIVFPSNKGPVKFKEIMAPHQRDWFEAIAPSILAVANGEEPPVTRFWSERTKGGSKDSDAATVLLWLLAFSRKLDMQVGAADRDQANELKKAAQDILRLNPWLAKRVDVLANSLVNRKTGSECTIVAADVAGSHGARPDITLLNELSHVTKEEFAENLLDNATKKPYGLVIIATNAGFVGTWQERWRNVAMESDRWNFHSFTEPAPWLSDEEVEEAERRNSLARFNRLFYGVWASNFGDALDEEDIKAATEDALPPRGEPGMFYVAGLDLGIRHDHSALVVIGGNRETLQLHLAYAREFKPGPNKKVDLIAVENAVLEVNAKYDLVTTGYDPYQAALMAQRLEARRVEMYEMTFTGANLNLMASTLLDVFRSRRIKIYNEPKLIRDLSRLQIEEKSYGYRLTATRDDTGHADLATALAIALPLAVEECGELPVWAGGLDTMDNLSPYERAISDFEERQRNYDEEREYLASEHYHNGPIREFLKLIRRGGGNDLH